MVSTPEELQKQWIAAKLPTGMEVPVEMVMELAMEIAMEIVMEIEVGMSMELVMEMMMEMVMEMVIELVMEMVMVMVAEMPPLLWPSSSKGISSTVSHPHCPPASHIALCILHCEDRGGKHGATTRSGGTLCTQGSCGRSCSPSVALGGTQLPSLPVPLEHALNFPQPLPHI